MSIYKPLTKNLGSSTGRRPSHGNIYSDLRISGNNLSSLRASGNDLRGSTGLSTDRSYNRGPIDRLSIDKKSPTVYKSLMNNIRGDRNTNSVIIQNRVLSSLLKSLKDQNTMSEAEYRHLEASVLESLDRTSRQIEYAKVLEGEIHHMKNLINILNRNQ